MCPHLSRSRPKKPSIDAGWSPSEESMERRKKRHGWHIPDRRTLMWDRRDHQGWTRILYIPLGRLIFEFHTVTFF